jgi:copper chaperone
MLRFVSRGCAVELYPKVPDPPEHLGAWPWTPPQNSGATETPETLLRGLALSKARFVRSETDDDENSIIAAPISGGSMSRETISVPDISCNHCKMSIESAVGALTGVERVEVHIDPRTVDVAFDEASISLDDIHTAIEDQGYVVATT